ncbi:hypothetical protein ASPCAL07740 [Aspergillus calidoustus]|uniref:Uncharacterized protein n=1 Tax=Aspergillus calidoustus TaxID=454130 RepID=A0A0U5GTE6_ASPCI|nr:hypothetical protein ASPCAL07740 [Aspergillus calidoustus]
MPFFPVAAHFKLFNIVGQSDKALSAREALAAYNSTGAIAVTATGPGLPLFRTFPLFWTVKIVLTAVEDTLLAMGSLGLMDVPKDDHYTANDLTRYLASNQSAIQGGIH